MRTICKEPTLEDLCKISDAANLYLSALEFLDDSNYPNFFESLHSAALLLEIEAKYPHNPIRNNLLDLAITCYQRLWVWADILEYSKETKQSPIQGFAHGKYNLREPYYFYVKVKILRGMLKRTQESGNGNGYKNHKKIRIRGELPIMYIQ